MNDASHKKTLGVDPELEFKSCNMQVNQAFLMQGDGMHNSALLLTDLVNDGVRLLVYAGNADYMCNFIVSSVFRITISLIDALGDMTGQRSLGWGIRQ